MSTTRSHAPVSSLSGAPGQPVRRPVGLLGPLALTAVVLLIFALQLWHFWPFLTDDAFISLRYSERLLHGHGLTWNDMRPVEGYTNLLWVLACAALGAVGVPLPAAAQGLGIGCTLIGIAAVAAQAYRDFPAKVRWLAALFGCGALVLSGPVDVWAMGGLEQPMLAALLAWAAYFGLRWVASARPHPRDTAWMGALLGLACLTRADAALFTAAFFLGGVAADGVRLPSLISRARLLPIPILFSLGQLFFRRAYYGDWLPNTAYVKVAFTLHRLRTGLKYDLVGLETELAFCVLALIGLVALWIAGKQRQIKFLATVIVVWLLYIVLIGGDTFPAVRHLVPVLYLGAFLASGCGLLTLAAPFRFSRGRVAGLLAVLALVLVSDHFCRPETWEMQGKSIGLFLRQAFGARRPLLSSDPAGAVPFYSELPAIDPLGLNDYHIARRKSAERGRGWVGHELADGKYVLDQKPDLLIFSDYQGDIYLPSDQEIAADPRFRALYQPVRFNTDPPYPTEATIYVRRIDGRLGIQTAGDSLMIPAYLAAAGSGDSVRLVDGRAQLVLPPHGTARFEHIPLGAGDWKLRIEGRGAPQVAVTGISPAQARPGCEACLHLGAPNETEFVIQNESATPAVVSDLALDRRSG